MMDVPDPWWKLHPNMAAEESARDRYMDDSELPAPAGFSDDEDSED